MYHSQVKYCIFLMLIILSGCRDSWVDNNKEIWINFNDTNDDFTINDSAVDSASIIRVAVASMTSPAETMNKYHQLFSYMEGRLGKKIVLLQRKTYKEVNDLLKADLLDMAFICSGAYVAGVSDSAFNLFLMPERDNLRHYHANIIVKKDSPYHSFIDLKGKRFVFSDSLSNTGMFYPLKRLHDFNTDAESFFSETYLSNAHDNSIELVNRGIVDGASVNSLIFDYTKEVYPEKVMNIRVIEESQPFGMPPLVTSKHIDSSLRKNLFDVLTNMVKNKEGRDILRSLMINRFVTDSDTLYDDIRVMCNEIGYFNKSDHDSRKSLSIK